MEENSEIGKLSNHHRNGCSHESIRTSEPESNNSETL